MRGAIGLVRHWSMPVISYTPSAETLTIEELSGFFVGWPQPPSDEQRLRILRAADEVVLARDEAGVLVGFITAISDGVFASYIPLLEVLPDSQGQAIGKNLMEAMLARLQNCYMIDLVCDDDVVDFYEQCGGGRLQGVGWRNYEQLRNPT